VAGTTFNFTVNALDSNGNLVTGYNGTVHFSTNNTNPLWHAVLPANATLSNGIGGFTATLYGAGSSTISAADTVNSSVSVTSGTITVSPAPANHFTFGVPTSVRQGTPFSYTVTIQDQFYNTITGYTGTVQLLSTDSAAVLPAPSTLSSGTGIFTATLSTVGSQSLIGYDTANNSLTGVGTIAVTAAPVVNPATHFLITAPGAATAGNGLAFEVMALDQFNNTATAYTGTVHLGSSDGQGLISSTNATLNSGVGFFAATLRTAGIQSLTANDITTATITGPASRASLPTTSPRQRSLAPAARLQSPRPPPTTLP
jgi:hypothetical protein